MPQNQRERTLTYFLFSYKLTQQILKAKDTNRQVGRQMVFTSLDSGRIIRVQSDRPEGAKNQRPHFKGTPDMAQAWAKCRLRLPALVP